MYYPYVTFCVVGHFRNLNLQVLCFWAILQHRAWLIYLVKFAELSKIIHKCISIVRLEALLTNALQCWESHRIILSGQEMHHIQEFIQNWSNAALLTIRYPAHFLTHVFWNMLHYKMWNPFKSKQDQLYA